MSQTKAELINAKGGADLGALNISGSAPDNSINVDSSGRLLVGTSSATANGGILQVSDGITFPATQSACSNPNTLDDYEEGNWTPTLNGSVSSPSVSYSVQNGTYVKVGKKVTCRFYLQFSFTGGSGTVIIGGLPFVSDSTTNTYSEFILPYAPRIIYPSGGTTVGLELAPASTSLALFGMGNNFSSYISLVYGTHLLSGTVTLFLATITYISNA